MSKYLLLTVLFAANFIFVHAQPTTMPAKAYEKEWKLIDSLEGQGLPQSALEAVESLLAKTKTDGNLAQNLKAFIYYNKFKKQLEEDGEIKAIARFVKQAVESDFPVKAILQSMLGELYADYLRNNRWTLQERTNMGEEKGEDLNTWTTDQIAAESAKYYIESIQYAGLKQIPIENFEAITTGVENTADLRPTLYDFLVFRALDHFMDETSYVTQPAYRFKIDQKEAFAPASNFVGFAFNTQDSLSHKWRTLKLFQEVIRFHLNDPQPEALVDADLKRLQFVHQNSEWIEKDSLYLVALEQMATQYVQHTAWAEILYHQANYYLGQGLQYDPQAQNDPRKWYLKKAKEICDMAISKFPDSYGAGLCKSLIGQLLVKSMEVQTEVVNLPEQASLLYISHRNIEKLFFKVVKIEENEREVFPKPNFKDNIQWLKTKTGAKNWSQTLPTDGDYQQHSTELKIDALPYGYYALLMGDNAAFSNEGHGAGYMTFHVSRIGYFTRTDHENNMEFIVVDRSSGAPMQGVTATFYEQQYNQNTRQYNYHETGTAISDAKGLVVPPANNSDNFKVKFSKGIDVFNPQESYYNYRWRSEPQRVRETAFFLDRAIYRPGQTVYFKGVAVEKDLKGKPSILAREKVEVTFFDVNGQEVSKLELRTNEYGSFNGAFTAPKTGLLGQMYLFSSIGNSTTYFRVEEYKRPKFEVSLLPLDSAYSLGDQVHVKGKAMAFAGNAVDGAKVKYRVVREVSFPWIPWWKMRFFPIKVEEMEVTNGESFTDAQGNFSFSFQATPDDAIANDRNPAFHFTVYADVVDVTGETHSAQKSTRLAHLGLTAAVDIPDQLDVSRQSAFKINIRNLDDQPQAATGEIKIVSLKGPNTPFIERYWTKPDQWILPETTFKKDFPLFAYKNEQDIDTWPVSGQWYSGTFNTGQSDTLAIPNIGAWQAGSYLLKITTTDKRGNKIETEQFFEVFDGMAKKIPAHTTTYFQTTCTTCEPGEKSDLIIASGFGDVNVYLEQERDGNLIAANWHKVNPWQEVPYTTTEDDRGGFSRNLVFVRHNRAFSWQQSTQVPWSNKDLKIEFSTFRDKLLPGQQEEWRITISGPKKEKVAAEMVAGMYDASLDDIVAHNWYFSPYPQNAYPRRQLYTRYFSAVQGYISGIDWQPVFSSPGRSYRNLDWFGFQGHYGGRYALRSMAFDAVMAAPQAEMAMESRAVPKSGDLPPPPPGEPMYKDSMKKEDSPVNKEKADGSSPTPQLRTNLNETVFFYPNLLTDADGNIVIAFKMNEALTKWKFLGFAHTKDLEFGLKEASVVTQKELMILPNAPRFVREGDKIEFTAKVNNLSAKPLTGTAKLELFDAANMTAADALFANVEKEKTFSIAPGQSQGLSWSLTIPTGKVAALTHRVICQADNFSDGEESSIPVLANRMLVTETMPVTVRGKESKVFTFKAMEKAGDSKTLQHHHYSLEFNSNPAWYAVQSLPYLMEYPYDCIEQVFNRYYANSLATHVANSTPKIKQVFESWKNTDALESALTKNQELKTALLEETPWVLEAQSEAQQKKNIGLLFDLNRMSHESVAALAKIRERQTASGGFSWFPGGRENWYITQYIVEGLGHLRHLKVKGGQADQVTTMTANAVGYIQNEVIQAYNELKKQVEQGHTKWDDDHLYNLIIHYLYTKSFYPEYKAEGELADIEQYYLGQAEKYWTKKGLYEQGMMALALHRFNKKSIASNIVKSLKERALKNEELGMYWNQERGYFWHQLPIETHSLMIEVFSEVAGDERSVEELKIWLLKNKQTTHWKTTKATSAAIYALLLKGEDWLMQDQPVAIAFDNKIKKAKRKKADKQLEQAQLSAEAGTGYFKYSWQPADINQSMSTIAIANPNKTIAWGAAYWQYFENLDQIKTFEDTPLQLKKQLYKEENSDRGPVLVNIEDKATLQPGDKLIVRIELRVDRDMEYIHMKDMRASGFEPIDALSGYRWGFGLGYYQSPRDAATHFFIDYLPKGTYVFEYPVRVVHKGDFSNGITSIQCMYAPEFSSHSQGVRVKVE